MDEMCKNRDSGYTYNMPKPIRAKNFGVFEKIKEGEKIRVVLFEGTECFCTEVARMMLKDIQKDHPNREFFVSTLN